MVIVGLAYLFFEKRILADFATASTPKTQNKENDLSRGLVGVQVSHQTCTDRRFLLTRLRLDSLCWPCT